jgi:ribosomal protein L3 glutamine methyltransferase
MRAIAYKQEEIPESLQTITDFIRWGGGFFKQSGLYFGHGTSTAIDEAAFLVLHTLGLAPDTPSVYFSSQLTLNEKQALTEIIFRRVEEKIPAAYLTCESWFAGLPFYVDERVLVPRSPLAELIVKQFEDFIDPDAVGSLLDLCTGSGCIGIACACHFPVAQVDLADISSAALEVAHINVERHQLTGHVDIIQSDLFSNLQNRSYDLIISNPPYVDAEDMAALPQEYKAEPPLGLAAGEDGLDLVIPMLKQAAEHMNPGGTLIVEVGNSEHALTELYPEVPFFWLEFEHGGQGIFLLTREQLEEYFVQ